MKNKEKALQIYRLIKSGDIEKAKKAIISNMELLDFVTPFGTWLHVAAEVGELEMIEFLVELGMDVNINEGVPKSAPIAHAAGEGYLEIVKYLFNKGAILDINDPSRNPLFSAIYGGHLDIVKYLVKNGINITIKYIGDIMKDMGAYEYAIELGQTEIAEYLKEKLEQ